MYRLSTLGACVGLDARGSPCLAHDGSVQHQTPRCSKIPDEQQTGSGSRFGNLLHMARKDISMTDAEVAAFLSDGQKVLQVATLGKDGGPHLAPMWFVMDEGRIVFRSFTKSQKIVNLNRDPRLSVLVESGGAYSELRGIMIRGSATLVTDPSYVLSIYGRLAARYPMVGSDPVELDSETLEQAFGSHASKNTAVVVEPSSTSTWDHTKLGGAY